MTYESVPTIDGVVGISSYGAHAVLFTIGRNHTVQQYDLNPEGAPSLMMNVQHVPAIIPPSPPISERDRPNMMASGSSIGRRTTPFADHNITSESEAESDYTNPIQRNPQDQVGEQSEEDRDILAPLSPVSSHASSTRSSVRSGKPRKRPTYPTRYDRSQSSRLRPNSPANFSTTSSTKASSTVFSSASSTTSDNRKPPSRLRNDVNNTPKAKQQIPATKPAGPPGELFPFVKARLTEVQFKPPRYPDGGRTPDFLRQELVRCIFGWDGEVEELIQYEISHHEPGSSSSVLLSKWLGDLGADLATSMIGSQSMTSSDWMLLALSNMGASSQKHLGDTFVQRLLEKGDVHPAVAILLGLGENNEAIEIYVSRGYLLESVILTCLLCPNDWQRISHLARQWGEQAIGNKESELAVRCFACTSVESSEPWFSPASKDAVYQAQMRIIGPDTSPLNRTPIDMPPGSSRLAPSQAGLKLITDFTNKNSDRNQPRTAMDDRTPIVGRTPMEDSSYHSRWAREPMSSMTATPGGFTSRRMASKDRARDPFSAQPVMSAIRSEKPDDNYLYAPGTGSFSQPSKSPSYLPSPAESAFSQEKIQTRLRNGSRSRKPGNLHVNTSDTASVDPSLPSGMTDSTAGRESPALLRLNGPSPAPDHGSRHPRGIDEYIVSVAEATHQPVRRAESQIRVRAESQARDNGRTNSRSRAPSETGSRRYIRPSKRSPSSPVSMSPDDPALRVIFDQNHQPLLVPGMGPEQSSSDAENFYRLNSPVSSVGRENFNSTSARERKQSISSARPASRSDRRADPASIARPASRSDRRTESASVVRTASRPGRRAESVGPPISNSNTDRAGRAESRSRAPQGRAESRHASSEREPGRRGRSRQPESPHYGQSALSEPPLSAKPRDQSVGARVRARGNSKVRGASQTRITRDESSDRNRARSSSRRPTQDDRRAESPPRAMTAGGRTMSRSRMPKLQTNFSENAVDTRRTLAAQDLEARRQSLLRRPSVPIIMHPHELITSPKSTGNSMSFAEQDRHQGSSGEPEIYSHSRKNSAGAISSVSIGLPSNPKVMQHARYTSSDNNQASDMTLPSSTFQLPSATFQPPSRAASAPPEKQQLVNRHISRESLGTRQLQHTRMSSLNQMITTTSDGQQQQQHHQPPPPPPAFAIDGNGDAVLSSDVIVMRESAFFGEGNTEVYEAGNPLILPELQHLVGPGNTDSGDFSSVNNSTTDLGVLTIGMMTPDPVGIGMKGQPQQGMASPGHRRGRASIGGTSINEVAAAHNGGLGGKLRGVRDRFRDGSQTRTQSPPLPPPAQPVGRSPYESIQDMDRSQTVPPQQAQPMTLAPVAYNAGLTLSSATYNPNAGTLPSTTAGYRNPKDIARALPSTTAGYRTPKEIARAAMQAANSPPAPAYHEQPQWGVNYERLAPQSMSSTTAGYRNPKEIRADMPPSSIQSGTSPMHPQNLHGTPF